MPSVCVVVVGVVGWSCLRREAAPVVSPSMGVVVREVISMPAKAGSGVRISVARRGTTMLLLVTAVAVATADRVLKIRRDSSSGDFDGAHSSLSSRESPVVADPGPDDVVVASIVVVLESG